jgi:hypothetical protein
VPLTVVADHHHRSEVSSVVDISLAKRRECVGRISMSVKIHPTILSSQHNINLEEPSSKFGISFGTDVGV